MKTIRHTANVPAQMEKLPGERIQDYRSLSSYFVSLGCTDALCLPKRPIAKVFANAYLVLVRLPIRTWDYLRWKPRLTI